MQVNPHTHKKIGFASGKMLFHFWLLALENMPPLLHSITQSSVSLHPSEIIQLCLFSDQVTFLFL